jgi:hypothetical protein
MGAVEERWPALLATSARHVLHSSNRQALHRLRQWQGTLKTPLSMKTTRASDRTHRLAPDAPSSRQMSNGTVSVATPGAAQ